MTQPFKTIAVVGKPDGVGVPGPLALLHQFLSRRGVAVVMDERTAALAPTSPARVLPLESLFAEADL
ncbi:MAG: hypothetical protein ACK50D_14865 [Burkholderiales bacterium]